MLLITIDNNSNFSLNSCSAVLWKPSWKFHISNEQLSHYFEKYCKFFASLFAYIFAYFNLCNEHVNLVIFTQHAQAYQKRNAM